ncbi:MAG: TetR/AcrR family transcriptional regulator [Deltaproteobacteria bacterium]|nr:TetR/AcrR family transcriptional regulator [Deltaproteobacteria bacterium]
MLKTARGRDLKTGRRRDRATEGGPRRGGTAERLRGAAVELFSRHGFDGVSVRDIAGHAGVNKGLVFYHFETKAKLFACLIDDYYEAYSRVLAASLAIEGSQAERIHQLLDANLDFIEENLDYVRIVQLEIGLGSETLPRIRQGIEVLYDAVAEVMKGVSPAKGPLSARHFFVSLSGMVNTYFLYASAIEPFWGSDPLSVRERRERREHLHWMLDAIVGQILAT